ncbi:MAG: hypothetical protein AAF990_22430 [Bacteroidota bacterium]
MRKFVQILYVLGFGLLLGVVPLTMLLFDYEQENVEYRKLAVKPVWSETTLKNWPPEYEKYFNDHFPFRDRLYRAFSRWKVDVMKESPKRKRVILGKEGWLFLSGERTLDQYRGIDPLKAEELDKIEQQLREKLSWCKERGVLYGIVICPEKHSVYPDLLPDWMKTAGPMTRTNQVLERIQKIDGLLLIDLREALRQARKELEPLLYYKYDTHWNHLGAYVGYRKMIDALTAYKDIPLRDWSDYRQLNIEKKGGDLARILNQMHWTDSVPTLEPLFEPVAGGDTAAIRYLEPTKLTFAAFENTDSSLQHKLLIFNDSYSVSLRRYLKDSFRQSAFVWNHHFKKEMVEDLKPDIVLQEFVERYVHRVGW